MPRGVTTVEWGLTTPATRQDSSTGRISNPDGGSGAGRHDRKWDQGGAGGRRIGLDNIYDKAPFGSKSIPESARVRACKAGSWSVLRIAKDGKVQVSPYRCYSWRHTGECSRAANAVTFARIKRGIEDYGRPMVYLVVTMPQRNYAGDTVRASREFYRCMDLFRKRIERRFGKIHYVCVMEEHRSGFPHGNMLIGNERLFDLVSDEMDIHPEDRPFKTGWLEQTLQRCGFGRVCYCDPVRGSGSAAGYMVKPLSEQSKISQLPVRAPTHFRRVRSSRGFLISEKQFLKNRQNPDIKTYVLRARLDSIDISAIEKMIMDSTEILEKSLDLNVLSRNV